MNDPLLYLVIYRRDDEQKSSGWETLAREVQGFISVGFIANTLLHVTREELPCRLLST